jgi:hypothetical protein
MRASLHHVTKNGLPTSFFEGQGMHYMALQSTTSRTIKDLFYDSHNGSCFKVRKDNINSLVIEYLVGRFYEMMMMIRSTLISFIDVISYVLF